MTEPGIRPLLPGSVWADSPVPEARDGGRRSIRLAEQGRDGFGRGAVPSLHPSILLNPGALFPGRSHFSGNRKQRVGIHGPASVNNEQFRAGDELIAGLVAGGVFAEI